MSHHVYTTPGFLISGSNIGEANKLFYIFTKDLGMVVATAQGIRHLKSKLRPFTQDFSYSRYSLVRGKEMWRMTSAGEAPDSFFRVLKSTPEYFKLYAQILVLIKRLIPGEEKNEELFMLALRSFEFLAGEKLSKEQLLCFEYAVVLKLLYNLGYIRKEGVLEQFVTPEFSSDMLQAMDTHKKLALVHINQALRVSHM